MLGEARGAKLELIIPHVCPCLFVHLSTYPAKPYDPSTSYIEIGMLTPSYSLPRVIRRSSTGLHQQ